MLKSSIGRDLATFYTLEQIETSLCYDGSMNSEGDGSVSKLSEQEIGLIAQRARELARVAEGDYYRYIDQQAVIDGVRSSELSRAVRAFNKEWRFGKNKDKIRFYHATSMQALKEILRSGELLSRRVRAVRGEDLTSLPWSSSENLQFTYDSFGPRGELRESGLGVGSGAAGSDLSFVFGGDLMDEPSFDATTVYPSVEKVSLVGKCLGVLVRDEANVDKVEALLRDNNIDLPVYSARKYDVRTSAEELQEMKTRVANERFAMPEQEKMISTELLREAELSGAIKLLDATNESIKKLSTIARGDQAMKESVEALQNALMDMKTQSEDYLATMRNGRGLGEVLIHGNEYAKTMEEELGFAMRALDILRRKVQALPTELADTFMNDVQQIENNMHMAYETVVRKRSVEI